MAEKAFKLIGIIFFVFSLFILIGGKLDYIGRNFLLKEIEYLPDKKSGAMTQIYPGDQYLLCSIDLFKGKITMYPPEKSSTTIGEAEMILIGDSFANSTLMSPILGTVIEKETSLKTYNVKPEFAAADYPLLYLDEIHYKPGRRKKLILEVVERYSVKRANKLLKRDNTYKMFTKSNLARLLRSSDRMGNIKKDLLMRILSPMIAIEDQINIIFDNRGLAYFYNNNIISGPIIKMLKNIRFNLFGEIDVNTPVYSVSPPIVFYREEVEFNEQDKGNDIKYLADHVTQLRDALDKEFNLDLIYIIIPNKYSVYCDLSGRNIKYDGFIPKVVEQLKKNGVKTIDMYSVYMQYRSRDDSRMLYFPQDTHYTPLGKYLLAKEIAKVIKNNK